MYSTYFSQNIWSLLKSEITLLLCNISNRKCLCYVKYFVQRKRKIYRLHNTYFHISHTLPQSYIIIVTQDTILQINILMESYDIYIDRS